MAKKSLDEIILELKQELENLGVKPYDRQHGRKGETKENEEEEKKRLRNNLASQLSRARKRKIIADNDASVIISYNKDFINDENGINKVDERRFKQCFIYENIAPEYDYVRRMTGLNLEQINILEQKYKMFCAKEM